MSDGKKRALLHAFDMVLTDLRRFWETPLVRQRFATQLSVPIELAQIRTLRAVEARMDKETTIGDVADALSVAPSTASRLVGQVVEPGYLVRRPSSDDGRRTVVRLTDQGRSILAEATDIKLDVLDDVLTTWSSEDVDQLTLYMRRLKRDLDKVKSYGNSGGDATGSHAEVNDVPA